MLGFILAAIALRRALITEFGKRFVQERIAQTAQVLSPNCEEHRLSCTRFVSVPKEVICSSEEHSAGTNLPEAPPLAF
jgi:hypothetical protein